jgi:aspartate aminotransferase
MTGWRLGYAIGPRELTAAVKTLIGQSTTNACSISQEAAVEALRGSQDFFAAFNEEYALRRDVMMRELDHIEGLHYVKPDGAFYIFVSCKQYLNSGYVHDGKPIKTDADFVSYILEESGVSGVPGSAFGKEGYFRLCFAKSREELKEAMDSMKEAVKRLRYTPLS